MVGQQALRKYLILVMTFALTSTFCFVTVQSFWAWVPSVTSMPQISGLSFSDYEVSQPKRGNLFNLLQGPFINSTVDFSRLLCNTSPTCFCKVLCMVQYSPQNHVVYEWPVIHCVQPSSYSINFPTLFSALQASTDFEDSSPFEDQSLFLTKSFETREEDDNYDLIEKQKTRRFNDDETTRLGICPKICCLFKNLSEE